MTVVIVEFCVQFRKYFSPVFNHIEPSGEEKYTRTGIRFDT